MPTTLVLYFNQALDPETAQDASDYRVITRGGKTIRVNSAVYDPNAHTVTLHPSQRIDIHYLYELIVDGTAPGGLTNTNGQLLDGTDSGKPGSDYKTSLTWRNLVLDPPAPRISRPTKTTTRSVKVKSEPVARAASHKVALFTRARAFRRPV